jgi:hypothetical protein
MLRRKPKRTCQTPNCSNVLPEEPAIIYVGEYAFDVCEECEKLMDIIQEKTEEHYGDESI